MSGSYTFWPQSFASTSSNATDNRLVAVLQHLHDVVGDRLREPALLLLGFAGPQFHNHVRHGVTVLRIARR
jgi:hypothetical protein